MVELAANPAATQQPDWAQHPAHTAVLKRLRLAAPLVDWKDTHRLQQSLARVARGEATVVQLGDCAESMHSGLEQVDAQVDLLLRSARQTADATGLPVLPIGRIAGQYGKPRSQDTELVEGRTVAVFRGHIANSEVATLAGRRADPRRMLWAHEASASAHQRLQRCRWPTGDDAQRVLGGPWTSHEALVLDYERALVRTLDDGKRYLSSTHFPWIGDRTRNLNSAHVRLLAEVAGPVACKVGPSTDPDELSQLCEVLDPDRCPGRLTLILRLGRHAVSGRLPTLVSAVQRTGHRVVWLSDPMHGNTVRSSVGRKTRFLSDVVAEAVAVRRVLTACGEHAGGLHLEASSELVTECVGLDVTEADLTSRRYTSLCDPRLNPLQTQALIAQWGSAADFGTVSPLAFS